MLKQQKGITLLALVFTIIAMLALAAIAVAMVLDELSYDPDPKQVESKKSVVSTYSPESAIETPEIETPITDNPNNN